MYGSGRETLPNVREWWEVLLNVLEASQLSVSGQETLPDVRECSKTLPNVREAITEVQEW